MPGLALVERLEILARHVLFEPAAGLLEKRDVFGRVVQIHRRLLGMPVVARRISGINDAPLHRENFAPIHEMRWSHARDGGGVNAIRESGRQAVDGGNW